jgi:DNA-binding NtrC family response regulator
MISYPWPGNIRELRNSVERAVLLSEDNTLRLKLFSNLSQNVDALKQDNKTGISAHPHFIKMEVNYTKTQLKEIEKLYINSVLEKNGGNKSKAAEFLGISRPRLDRILK